MVEARRCYTACGKAHADRQEGYAVCLVGLAGHRAARVIVSRQNGILVPTQPTPRQMVRRCRLEPVMSTFRAILHLK